MSTSSLSAFLTYLVRNLIKGFFEKKALKGGNKYFLRIENEDYCEGLIEAIKCNSEAITISDIFPSTQEGPTEVPYKTYVIRPEGCPVGLIVAFEKNATEDYLTTLRNSVGAPESKYKDYAVLFILNRSVLSSLISSCLELTQEGLPLNSRHIINEIKTSAPSKITRKLERDYLYHYIEKLDDYIKDGSCDLFDFQHALSVLSDNSLEGHFSDMEYFSDSRIYDDSFQPLDKAMRARIEQNRLLFHKISAIMNNDEADDKMEDLNKILDEKLSKEISKSEDDDWKKLDLEKLLESQRIKQETDNLQIVAIELVNEGITRQIIINPPQIDAKHKSKRHIIICDISEQGEAKLKIKFNKRVLELMEDRYEFCSVSGQIVTVTVGEKTLKLKIGRKDNYHEFCITKIESQIDFFRPISNCFKIAASTGKITIDVPEDEEELTFGPKETGHEVRLEDSHVTWHSNMKLIVPLAETDGSIRKEFSVTFGKKLVPFVLRHSKPIPPVGPESFPKNNVFTGIPSPDSPYWKVADAEGGPELPILEKWREYLEYEHEFIWKRASYLETGDQLNADRLVLPDSVQETLDNIYTFFQRQKTTPSLCPVTAELRELYIAYCSAIKMSIANLSPGRELHQDEYNLTKLGTVFKGGKLYLSPFHPLIISYILEFDEQTQGRGGFDLSSPVRQWTNPFYIMPYIYFHDQAMRPVAWEEEEPELKKIQNWLIYEKSGSAPQKKVNDITTKMVKEKMEKFTEHFNHLFQDPDSPIVIRAIGLYNDTNIVKGIIEYICDRIKNNSSTSVQKIELHMHVKNLQQETFFETLNRCGSTSAVLNALLRIDARITPTEDASAEDIVRLFFTRVGFYKHAPGDPIDYCHIAFFQINEKEKFVERNTNDFRPELAMNGLISIPSTLYKEGKYMIGFGTKNVPTDAKGHIYSMAICMNKIYANEKDEGSSVYKDQTCVAKQYRFESMDLLQSIYDNANWVTFLNPEVDINFFYKQKDIHIIHYTDQYTINAKYDSITVTKHVDLYESIIRNVFQQYDYSGKRDFGEFSATMIRHFNCLNGRWLLNLAHKTEVQRREKMSMVAACIAMLRFMKRNKDVIWIPVSLDEIFRVTGSIGLPMEHIFSKKALGGEGEFSDDLLMIGLDATDSSKLKLYLYPTEVKYAQGNDQLQKGRKQACNTYSQLRKELMGEPNFKRNLYRTFFATQFLTNAEKRCANELLSQTDYDLIDRHRYKLLNLEYSLEMELPAAEIGNVALVYFSETGSRSMVTSMEEDVAICELHFSTRDCFDFIVSPPDSHLDFLEEDEVAIIQAASSDVQENTAMQNRGGENINETPEKETPPSDGKPAEDIHETSQYQSQPEKGQTQGIKITVGHTLHSKNAIVFEPTNTQLVTHPNMGIIGTMGTGKTQFTKSLIAQITDQKGHNVGGKPVGILVFDYKGDYNGNDFLERVGGHSYAANFPFNPLKLISPKKNVEGMNLPAIIAGRISDSFTMAYGLGVKQNSIIKQTIIKTYADAGITSDPATWNRQVPTMAQVIAKYFDTNDANDKAYAIFDKLRDYSVFANNSNACVSIFEWLNGVQVIDLTPYADETKKVIVSLVLDLFYAEMCQLGESRLEGHYRELRAMIMVDEAHHFLKKDFNSLRSIISEGRMFGVGMILSTQSISDFRSAQNNYTNYILSWVIHHVNSITRRDIDEIFGANHKLCDQFIDYINKADKFESLCKIGSQAIGIRDLPFFELQQKSEDKAADLMQ